jgi:hypothetical protein
MSTAALRGKVDRLRRQLDLPRFPEEDCPRPIIGLCVDAGPGGEAPPFDPADVAPCPTCGSRHIQVIVEEVVGP